MNGPDDFDFDEITPHLLVGSYPHSLAHVERLREAGVQAVLNLQADPELAEYGVAWKAIQNEYLRTCIVLRRVPIRDADEDDLVRQLPTAVSELHDLLGAGYRVYLHCMAGINRSPTVAIGWLHVYGKMAVLTATEYVAVRRACYPYPKALRAMPRVLAPLSPY